MASEMRRLQDEHDRVVGVKQKLLQDWIERYRNPERAPRLDAVFSDHDDQESASQFLRAMRSARVKAPILTAEARMQRRGSQKSKARTLWKQGGWVIGWTYDMPHISSQASDRLSDWNATVALMDDGTVRVRPSQCTHDSGLPHSTVYEGMGRYSIDVQVRIGDRSSDSDSSDTLMPLPNKLFQVLSKAGVRI